MNKVFSKYFFLKYRTIFSIFTLSFLISFLFPEYSVGQSINKTDGENFILASSKDIFSNVDLNDATAAIKVWGSELQKQLKMGVKFDLQIFDSAEDIVNSPQRDNFGLIIFNSVDYLNLKSKMQLYPVIVPYNGNNIYQKFLILVKDKKYRSLKDLKNRKLGLPKIFNNSIPAMWLEVQLDKNNLGRKEHFFSETTEYDKESELILSVFFGKNDVCVCSKRSFKTMVELNPQVGEQLSVVEESPNYITGLSCLTKNSSQFNYSNGIVDAALNLGNYSAGKQILILMKTEKVTRFKPEYLVSIQKLLKDYNSLTEK